MKPILDEATRRRRHRNERIAATVFVLLVALGVWWFIQWDRRAQEAFERERTYIPRVTPITREIELLQQFVRLDSSNPPGNEAASARWLATLLEQNGIRAEIIASAPNRLNVHARIRGKRPGEGLLLLQHLDVVPASAAGWEHPPFSGEIRHNQLHGRGALDMKSIGLTHALAMIEVARGGRTPERDLVLLAVADEETGSVLGMQWLLANRPELFEGIRYALGEGGITELVGEKMTYFGIEIGGKHYSRAIVEGPTLEAMSKARFALQRYTTRRTPERILPEVRRFFREIAPTRHHIRPLLVDVEATARQGRFWNLPPPYRELTANLVMMRWPSREGERWRAAVEMVSLPDEDTEQRLAWLAKELAPLGVRIVDVPVRGFAVPLSNAETPLFRNIARLAAARYSTTTGTLVLTRSANDSRFLRLRGITCYGVLPFPIDAFQSQSIHASNERIRLDWFLEGVALMRTIVTDYVFGAE